MLSANSRLSAAELSDLRECGCEATMVSNRTANGAKNLSCAAPGCNESACDGNCSNCDATACKAVQEACDTACHDDCGCDCLQCCNRWSVLAEAVFLRRSDSGSVPLVLGQETGETLLNANNLEYNHQAVPRLQLIHENCCCWGWDFGIFGTDGWSTGGFASGEPSPALVAPGIVIGGTAPGNIFQLDNSTSLLSTEFNIRRRCSEHLTWLAGFRWIELSDELNAASTAPTFIEFYSIDADNHLYGFQVGADAVLVHPVDHFRIDGIFRVGVLGNSADQTTRSPYLANFQGFVGQVSADDDDASFMAELGLRGVLQLTNSLAVTGGYQVLWLDGLALAPEQLPVTSLLAPGSAAVNTDGELLFHGAMVGLQLTY
jgi:hypothetical protein